VIVLAGDAGGAFAAGYSGGEDNFLANAHGVDFRTDLGDFTRNVAAGNVRKRDRHAGMPRRTQISRWFSAQALTRTRTSFGRMAGSGASVNFNTSARHAH